MVEAVRDNYALLEIDRAERDQYAFLAEMTSLAAPRERAPAKMCASHWRMTSHRSQPAVTP
jgi:hypothetical protein